MKFLKWLFIIVLVIVGIVLIYGATQPPQMTIEESIEIDAPAYMVFQEIEDFKAWDEWSAWNKMDPNMEQSFSGEVGQIGYSNSWSSENMAVGKGSQEVVEITKNEFMKTKMMFGGDDAVNYASFTLTENDGKTTVAWDMIGAETPIYARIVNTLLKPMITESYQTSLKNLKEVVESKPIEIPNPMNLEVMEADAVKIVSIRDTTSPAEISNKLTEIYTELSIYLSGQKDVEIVGMPIGIYHSYNDETVDMEGAFHVTGEPKNSGRVVVGNIPAGKVLKGVHLGSYESSGNTHMAMEEYVNSREDIEFDKICWEVYANDPTEVDSADIRTEIYYQLK